MIWAVILLIIGGLAYGAWEAFRTVRGIWRAAARCGETIGKCADRMSAIDPVHIAARPTENPRAVRARIALKRECGKEQRMAGTIERWAAENHV